MFESKALDAREQVKKWYASPKILFWLQGFTLQLARRYLPAFDILK